MDAHSRQPPCHPATFGAAGRVGPRSLVAVLADHRPAVPARVLGWAPRLAAMAEHKPFRGQPADDPDVLLERFLEVFVDRLVVGLLARVDQRLEQALAERGTERAAVDVATAAERLGISQRGVARLLANGRLPSLQVGRRRLIPTQALQHLVTNGSAEAIAPPEPRRLPRRR